MEAAIGIALILGLLTVCLIVAVYKLGGSDQKSGELEEERDAAEAFADRHRADDLEHARRRAAARNRMRDQG